MVCYWCWICSPTVARSGRPSSKERSVAKPRSAASKAAWSSHGFIEVAAPGAAECPGSRYLVGCLAARASSVAVNRQVIGNYFVRRRLAGLDFTIHCWSATS